LPPDAKVKGGWVTITDKQGFQKRCKVKNTPAGKRITVESSHYFLVFRDAAGVECRLKAYRDEANSKTLQEHVASLLYHKEKGKPLSAELHEWLDTLDAATHDALADFGLVPRRSILRLGSGLDDLLKAYADHLAVVRGDTDRYVEDTVRQIVAVCNGCGFKTADDIYADAIEAWLIKQRKEGQGYCGEKGWSVRTVNAHVRSIKAFAHWLCAKKKVLRANPVDAIDAFTSHETDIRRKRRALRTSEIFRLLRKTAEENVIREGMDGAERSLLYESAIKVGARANAIRHLRVCDFDFECEGGSTVRLLADHSKTHTTVVQPLEPDLAAKVQKFIQERGRQPEEFVFHGTYKTLTVFTAQILKDDAQAAQVAVKTDEGLIDFHALKHTFTSSLQGMDDTDKMALTGHKTRDMLSRYDHRSLEDKRALLSRVQAWGMAG
jgi:integrase